MIGGYLLWTIIYIYIYKNSKRYDLIATTDYTYTCKYTGSAILVVHFNSGATSLGTPKVNGAAVTQYQGLSTDSGWTNYMGYYIFQVAKGDVITLGTNMARFYGLNIENAAATVAQYGFNAASAISCSVKAPKGYMLFGITETEQEKTFTCVGTQLEASYKNKYSAIGVIDTKEDTTLTVSAGGGTTAIPRAIIVGWF